MAKGEGNAKREALNLSRCQQLKKKKKKTLASDQEGKSVSNDTSTQHMDIILHQATGVQFLQELIMEILIRLPVRSLLQSRCVSKSWDILISDPYFKKMHLSHAKNDLDSQKLLVLQQQFPWRDKLCFYSAPLSTVQLVEDPQKLESPLKCSGFTACKVFGSCDGLVLLHFRGKSDQHLLLWNPSTRESVLLPHLDFSGHAKAFGLGYDATGYKILKLDRGGSGLPTNEILALKGGSWKTISTMYPTAVDPKTGCECVILPALGRHNSFNTLAFLHGAFHWLGQSHVLSVVSFSIPDEVYGNISLLETMCVACNHYFYDRGISVLGGMLCFYFTHNIDNGCGTFKLWVMKEYGVKESWTNLLTIRETGLVTVKPTCMFADCEVLLCCRYVRYASTTFRTSKQPFGLDTFPFRYGVLHHGVGYTESLISPKSLI